MPDVDPFTTAYRQIKAALMARAQWAAMVRVGNFLDATEDGRLKQRIKGQGAPADFLDVGEVLLDQGAFTMLPFGSNSQIINASQTYILMIATQKMGTLPINAFKFETLRALHAWGPHLQLPRLIADWRIQDASDQPPGTTEQGRGGGYGAVLSIVTDLYIPKASLL